MISEGEIRSLTDSLGVPLPQVEKDYVMGWLLWGIYSHSSFAEQFVLKGGNCLRKAYFPDTRFSDDLDFTATRMPSEEEFAEEMARICNLVGETAEIPFETNRLRVEEKQTPVSELKALDGRVYFRGIAGDSSLVMRLKFDVSDYEKIVFRPVNRPLIHPYSDAEDCSTSLVAYAVEEVLAEKLRSWIQRTRARDLFDAAKIIQSHGDRLDKGRILRAFVSKTIFKELPRAGKHELLVDEKFQVVEEHWLRSIICPKDALIVIRNAIAVFRDFVTALFALPAAGPGGGMGYGAGHRPGGAGFRGGLRERIIQSGRARELVRLTYSGITREVEPYSFRYKTSKSDGVGKEYFYGFDRTRGQTIKSFLTSRIQEVQPTGRPFTPRFVVEF